MWQKRRRCSCISDADALSRPKQVTSESRALTEWTQRSGQVSEEERPRPATDQCRQTKTEAALNAQRERIAVALKRAAKVVPPPPRHAAGPRQERRWPASGQLPWRPGNCFARWFEVADGRRSKPTFNFTA